MMSNEKLNKILAIIIMSLSLIWIISKGLEIYSNHKDNELKKELLRLEIKHKQLQLNNPSH